MAAIPAWPPRSTPRLFVSTRLGEGLAVRIDGGQAHYLLTVMRQKEGAPIKLFDDETGEWLARIETAGKRDLILRIEGKLRDREEVPDFWLLAAPIKKTRIDWLAEKASELGIALFRPVITQRTIIERLNLERLHTQMIEAAEQCGRTALPAIGEAIKLPALLKSWPAERILFFADEEGGMPMAKAAQAHQGASALLIGPEGGFTAEERALVKAMPQAIPIALGPRILRAETAAIAATSVWMALNGDWGEPDTP